MRIAALQSVAVLIGVLLAIPAAAQRFDGLWAGRITCDALPGMTGRMSGDVTMRIAGNRASYERPIEAIAGRATDAIERGAGPVSVEGQVALNGQGAAAPGTFRASYEGRITGNTVRLAGEQDWRLRGRGSPFWRSCDINLTRQ